MNAETGRRRRASMKNEKPWNFPPISSPDDPRQRILKVLGERRLERMAIAREAKISTWNITATLELMEYEGLIERDPKNWKLWWAKSPKGSPRIHTDEQGRG